MSDEEWVVWLKKWCLKNVYYSHTKKGKQVPVVDVNKLGEAVEKMVESKEVKKNE